MMSASSEQTDGPGETPPQGDGAINYDPPEAGDDVSVLDMALVLVRKWKLIAWSVIIIGGIGLSYALLAPEQYQSEAKVVPESQEGRMGAGQLPSGLGIVQGLGINFGGTEGGLSPSSYPHVLNSRAVKLAVVQDTFSFPDSNEPMTFVQHVEQTDGFLGRALKYTVYLPWTLKEAMGELAAPSRSSSSTEQGAEQEEQRLSRSEVEAIATLTQMSSTSINKESGWMEITVTAPGPELAAEVAQSLVEHLRIRVQTLRTEKVRKRLQFIETRFKEVGGELEQAEGRLAQFLERNQNPTTAPLEFQRERLRRQVQFKEQLYSELQSQLTQTRLDLQQQQPVVTLVEQPAIPIKGSAPPRTLIVIVSLLAGVVVGVLAAFGKTFLENLEDEKEKKEKVDEIRRAFTTSRIRHWLGGESSSTESIEVAAVGEEGEE
jgi:uncharacterized protein involved in exopolysaccharide biosynthesis